MRRTAIVSLLLLVTSALVPTAAGAAAGDTVDLHVTYRGDTPWVTSADVLLGAPGSGTLTIDGALGEASATHPAPAGAGSTTTYDLTDVVPVPADAPFTVTAPNGAEVTFAGAHVSFGAASDEVTGTAGPGDTVDVTLRSGAQVLTTTVTADATSGAFTATFGTFDGTWEFGASITAAVTETAGDGTEVTLHVTQRLPSADITTQVVNAGPPATLVSDAVFTDITPGHPFAAVGEPATTTLATAAATFDPDADDSVVHLGRTLRLSIPSLSVDAADFGTDTIVGVAPAGATVDLLVATDAAVEQATVTAGTDGSWSYTFANDASTFAQVDAAIDHADGARHHARGSFPSDFTPADDAVLAIALLPLDRLVLLPFATGPGDTYELTAVQGGTTSTATVGGFDLLAGLAPDDFDPPVVLAGGMDVTIDQGGTVSSVRIPELTWSVAGSGVITGSTDAGQDVDLLIDVPIAGVTQATAIGAPSTGDFTVDPGLPFGDGAEVTATVFPDLNETRELVFVIDERIAGPIDHVVGSAGGRAPGLGNTALVVESLGLLSASSQIPTAWRMDAVAAAGGPADLTIRFPAEAVDADTGFFGLDAVTPIADDFVLEVVSGGTPLDASPVAITTYVPINVDGTLGTVLNAPEVLVDRGNGFEALPAGQTTICTEAGQSGCGGFPLPFAKVTDAPVGTYTVVDDTALPNTMTVDRVAGAERIQTAIELSKVTFPSGGADAVVVANAFNFPDALAATPLAAAANAPILLNPGDTLHPAVEAEIERLNVDRAYVMGGEAAISRSVQIAIGRQAGVTAVTRVGGQDRYDTAARAAQWAVDIWRARGDSSAGSEVLVTLGHHDTDPNKAWPDALVAGQLAAYAHQPILLTRQGGVPSFTNAKISELGTKTVTVVGGTAAIPDSTKDALGPSGINRARIAGADRYATGAALADEARFFGADDGRVLVATGLAFPDGLTAAAAAYHQGGVLLLAHGTEAARSAATLTWLDDRAGAVSLLRAVGGTSALSEGVLNALVDAASTGATTVQRQQAGAVTRSSYFARRLHLRS